MADDDNASIFVDAPVFEDFDSEGEYFIDETIPVDEDDGYTLPPAFDELTSQVLGVLTSAGLVGHILALQAGSESEILTQALEQLKINASYEARSHILPFIYRAVEEAEVSSRIAKRARGDFSHPKASRISDAVFWGQSSSSSATIQPALLTCVTRPARGTYAKRSSPGAALGTVATKAEKEAEILVKCQSLLVFYIMESNAPSAGMASSSSDQRRCLASLIGKTRHSTASSYLKKWFSMREWLLLTGQKPWPVTPGPLLDFLFVLGDQPCKPTIPQLWHQAILWMYKLGGYDGENNPAASMLVTKAVEMLTAELGR